MKAIIILTGLGIGMFLGLFPSIDKPRPMYWKILLISLMTGLVLLAFLPPTASSVSDAVYLTENAGSFSGDVLINIHPNAIGQDNGNYLVPLAKTKSGNIVRMIMKSERLPDEFREVNELIVNIESIAPDKFLYKETKYINPLITLPWLIQLQERIRIMNFHVPVAWVAVLAYLISMIYSIQYLKHRKFEYDIKASSAASLGTLFCVLATVTGMIWAKFNWGSFWNWDPRETSIFVLLLIYGAYFALRSAINNNETRARLSSVYSILAFITVPFFIFIIPRITTGLHPGSGGEENIGPVLSSQSEMLNTTMQFSFALGLTAFTILFFWMLNLIIRYKFLEVKKINQ